MVAIDTVTRKTAALGVPGLVLAVAMAANGVTGELGIWMALATLGGPLGQLGGIAVLGVLVLLADAVAEYGFGKFYMALLDRLAREGMSEAGIAKRMGKYPISKSLKRKLREILDNKPSTTVAIDTITRKIAALGVPGLVLAITIGANGLPGWEGVWMALVTLGGPFGQLGGMAVLGVLVLLTDAIAEYGFGIHYEGVLNGLASKGLSSADITERVEKHLISRSLRGKLREILDNKPILKFACPKCGQPLEADTDMADNAIQCPACQADIVIPQSKGDDDSSSTGAQVESPSPEPVPPSEPGQPASTAAPASPPESLTFRSAVPLAVYTLGLGWVATWILPDRFFITVQLLPVVMLALPSLMLAYVTVLRFLRPYPVPRLRLIWTCIFTMTVGLIFLLFFQEIAKYALHSGLLRTGNLAMTAYCLILKFIGWSYTAAEAGNFLTRMFGCIFGIGLCEEFTKLLPLFFYVLRESKLSAEKKLGYRQFLLVGFFSGLGFGIGEAIYGYAPWSGRISTNGNILRWFACVPSHAIYTVLDAAFLWYLKPRIQREKSGHRTLAWCAGATLVVAVVHGVYNSFAELPLFGFALDAFAIALMCWVVVLVPRVMNQEIPEPSEPGRLSSFAPLQYIQGLARGQRGLTRAYLISGGMVIMTLFFSSSKRRVLQLIGQGHLNRDLMAAVNRSESGRVSGKYYADLYGFGYNLSPISRVADSIHGVRRTPAQVRVLAYEIVPQMKHATPNEKEAIADGLVDGYLQVPAKYAPHDGTRLLGSPLDKRIHQMQSR